MLENPERFYKMNKLKLKDHKDILKMDDPDEDVGASLRRRNLESVPSYYKKIKIHKMNLYLTIKSTSMFTVSWNYI